MNKEAFYGNIKNSLFHGILSQPQIEGMEAILDASAIVSTNELAYILATIYHETAKTMQPIEEYGKGKNRTYGHKVKINGKPYSNTYNIFYGRGFVQLTWYDNYEKMGKIIGEDLINHPELCLTIPIATKICYAGMIGGLFTGKKLKDYFTETTDFINARRIINGVKKGETHKDKNGNLIPDMADIIEGYANNFLSALKED